MSDNSDHCGLSGIVRFLGFNRFMVGLTLPFSKVLGLRRPLGALPGTPPTLTLARLVAFEVNTNGTKEDSSFAKTPPLEAKKLLLAKYVDQPKLNGKEMRISVVDAKKRLTSTV